MIRYRLICAGAAGEPDKATAGAKAAAKVKAARSKATAAKVASERPKRKRAEGCGHEFESWFQSSDAFDKLIERGQISCPGCGSTHVEKSLMAPSVKTTKGKERPLSPSRPSAQADGALPAQEAPPVRALATLTPEQRAFVDTMRKVREHVLATSENVGKKFVEEARKMHYDEAETRSIHGEASIDDAKALAEEGIDIFPIPALPDDRN